MRYLILPSFYMQNVMACSGVRSLWAIGRGLVEMGHVVYMVFPEVAEGLRGSKEWNVTADRFMDTVPKGRAKPIWVPMIDAKYDNCIVPGIIPLVQQPIAEFAYDVLLDFSRTRSLFLRRIASEAYGGMYDVPVPIVNLVDDVNVKGKAHYRGEEVTLLAVLGCIGDWSCYTTEREKKLWLGEIRGIATPSIIRKWQQRSSVIGVPVDLTKMQVIYETRRVEPWMKDKVTVLYGGQLGAVKNVPAMVEQVARLYQTGLPIRMIITTMMGPTEQTDKWAKEYGAFLEMHFRVDGDQFQRFLAEADAYFCFSDSEGAGIGFVEKFASGLIGVYRNRDWVEGRLPPGYPWVGRNFDECGAMMAQLVKSFAKEREKHFGKQWPEWVIDRHAYGDVAKRVSGASSQAWNVQMQPIRSGWVYDLALRCGLDRQNEVTFDEVCAKLCEGSDKGVQFGFKKTVHGFYVRRLMMDLGYEDVGDVECIVFRRIDE